VIATEILANRTAHHDHDHRRADRGGDLLVQLVDCSADEAAADARADHDLRRPATSSPGGLEFGEAAEMGAALQDHSGPS
jgi:hypothetical protein